MTGQPHPGFSLVPADAAARDEAAPLLAQLSALAARVRTAPAGFVRQVSDSERAEVRGLLDRLDLVLIYARDARDTDLAARIDEAMKLYGGLVR